jgi:hypothetical protein
MTVSFHEYSFAAISGGTGPISVPGVRTTDKIFWAAFTPTPGQQSYDVNVLIDYIIRTTDEVVQIRDNGPGTHKIVLLRGLP